MTTALQTNPANMGGQQATFIANFSAEGRVYDKFTVKLTYSADEFLARLSNALMAPSMAKVNGYQSFEFGGIHLQVSPMGDHIHVDIEMMTDVYFQRAVKAIFAGHQWAPERVEGVYNIEINHWYLDKNQNMKVIEHYRDTEDFNKLFLEMYPRIDMASMMKMYSESDESNIILTGEPGTGKTCFAKIMMATHARTQESDIDVVYVKDRNLLKKDEFWALMAQHKPDMMILDDLDDELRPRKEERNEIVNHMLSYSDGLFDLDTKIVITTNLTDKSIDKALIRPGRCFDILSLPQLTKDEAKNIWIGKFEAPEAAFEDRFGAATKISQAAVQSEHARYLKSDAPTYLLDPEISIRKIVEEKAEA